MNGPLGVAPPVWLTGQQTTAGQFARGGYVTGTAADVEAVPPAVAAYSVATFTRPGDLVVDPNCGAGTVLVEAVRAGRHAVGSAPDDHWWTLARANLTAAKSQGAPTDGTVLDASLRQIGLVGTADLVLTPLRTGLQEPGDDLPGVDDDGTRADELCATAATLLRPGGLLVVVCRRRYARDGTFVDDPDRVLTAGAACGLLPVERCVALLAQLRGGRLVVRASPAERRAAAARSRITGKPAVLPAHADVVVLRARRSAEDQIVRLPYPWSPPTRLVPAPPGLRSAPAPGSAAA